MITEKVTWVHHWSDRTFSFRTTRGQSFKFYAGEFAMLGLMVDGRRLVRAYSVVSPPWADYLEFLSIKMPNGALTSKLQHIQIDDDVVLMEKTTGTLRNDLLKKDGELWMLATGTGLAPFVSLIRDIETLESWTKIHLVHSVRDKKDLAYYDELMSAFRETEPDLAEMIEAVLEYTPVVTGQGGKRITAQLLDGDLALDAGRDKVMICGNIEFTRQVADWCRGKGMTEGSLREPGDYVLERAFVEQ